jgi:hypothetical protein
MAAVRKSEGGRLDGKDREPPVTPWKRWWDSDVGYSNRLTGDCLRTMASQVHSYGRKERSHTMLTQTSTPVELRTKMFLDIPTAAELAGFSIRHFRRIIEEDRIPIVQIGRKFFILGRDFSSWESSKKMKRPA